MKVRPQILFVVLFVVLALVALGATTAFARVGNVITVNSTDGSYNPGDGKCTLREAINNANNNSNVPPNSSPDCASGFNADTIELGNNLNYELYEVDSGLIVDPNGMPVITSNITINGHGSTLFRSYVGGTPQFRIFKVNFSGVLTINDLEMFNGNSPNNGGGIWNEGSVILNNSGVNYNRGNNGGGIYTNSYLELNHSDVSNNVTNDGSSSGPTPGYSGGGIYSDAGGKLEISNSTINNNSTGIGGTSGPTTAKAGNGAGIYSANLLKITHSTLADNTTGRSTHKDGNGGGFYLNSSATILDTNVTGGVASMGGGIYNNAGTLNAYRVAFFSNEAVNGGGLYSAATANIYNSTLSDNAATNGGAIYSNGTTNVVYSTIANNATSGGANVRVNGGTYSTNNSIYGFNAVGANCSGTVGNQGKNIDSGTTCGFGSANNSVSNTDPKVFAIANNGGPSWTMAIAADSPARDKGDTAICTAANGGVMNIDQRTFLRIKVPSDICDIGAYEYGAAPGAVNPTATRTSTITPTNVPAGSTKTPTPLPVPPTATNTPDPCPNAPYAPVLKSPGQSATTGQRPTLKWNAANCATSYNVTVRMKNTVVDSASGLTELKYRTTSLAPGKYQWTVQACNAKGCNTSEIRKFTVVP